MIKDINEMTNLQIEDYLRERKNRAYSEKLRKEREAEEAFKRATNLNIYQSSDYCGMSIGSLSFYYGYEDTMCPKHRSEEQCERLDCELREWCFSVMENDKVLLRLPTSKLWFINDADIMWYLLSGIAQYLQLKNEDKL